jgi:hypothetical protein
MFDSTIINQITLQFLQIGFIEKRKSPNIFPMISTFHEKCDNKRATLVKIIVKITNSNQIVSGYNPGFK